MMNDKQLAVLYTIVLVLWVGSFALLNHLTSETISTQGYADKICQDQYGPQTGAAWINDQLVCQTVRGEIHPIKQP
jgi:hypothetical protein